MCSFTVSLVNTKMISTLSRRAFVSICVFRNLRCSFKSGSIFRSSSTCRDGSWDKFSSEEFKKRYPLTEIEAFSFVEDVLEIPEASKKLENDRKQFLDEFITQWYRRIPFTPIRYQSQTKGLNSFPVPTFLEAKDDVFSRIGGACTPLTCFTQALLNHFGYESYICDSSHEDVHSSHGAIIVRHLSGSGSRHLVDTGAGVPIFRAVSLDFENVSPVYRDDYMTYRFAKEADGTITFEKILEEDHYWDLGSSHSNKIGEWLSFMTYHTEAKLDLDSFMKTRKKLWELQNIRPCMFYSIMLIGFPEGRLCSISSTALYRATEEGKIRCTKLEGDDAINAVLRYYPQFPRSMVKTAFLNSQNRVRQKKMTS